MIDKEFVLLQEAVFSIISRFEMYDDKVILNYETNNNAAFLRFCISSGIIKEAAIKEKVHKRIIQIANVQFVNSKSEWADHVRSPHALAYGIRHGVFTPKQLGQIKFDHGDTHENFMAGMTNDLCEKIMQDLLKDKPLRCEKINLREI